MFDQTPLPAGWAAEWNAEHQRWLFINQTTGNTQWEYPESASTSVAPEDTTQPSQGRAKRRQYAAEQSQSYYDTPSQLHGQAVPTGVGQQFFTPGIAPTDSAHHAVGPQAQGYGQTAPVAPATRYGVDQLAGQFSQLGARNGRQQLQTTNLLNAQLDPFEPQRPPPVPHLLPNATVTQSEHANAPSSYQRCTVASFPAHGSLASKAKIPLALVINPYRSLKPGEDDVPLVTDTIIARCRRCRAYINPYVQFIDGNNRWKCCMCQLANDVPQAFDWDVVNNCPADRWARKELNYGVIEFVAPTEYMVRPPQPVVYVFLVDMSYAAVHSGMLATVGRTILDNLDSLPNEDGRTKIALIGFDAALYFFHMPPETTDFSMLVVADLDDIFIPKPTDILVNLNEARASINNLLAALPDMFQDNTSMGSALGPALRAGAKLMTPMGGKMIALTASLPTIGDGALKLREDQKLLGTPKESTLLQPASTFYKTFAIECSRLQVSVDMFLFGQTYQDVASLACIPHYTSGQTFYYPAFTGSRPEDVEKASRELSVVLAQPIMVEAVTRVRVPRGVRAATFHGNFFVRSTDLLAMPTVPQDVGYIIELAIEETLPYSVVVLQTAILHTTAAGERRIRVLTTAVPTTQNLSEVYASVDQSALASVLAARAVAKTLSHKLEDAREMLVTKLVNILKAYKGNMTAAGAGASAQLAFPENMRALPLLVLGILKSVAVRQSAQIPPDLRAWSQYLLTTLPCENLISYLHPNFYSLHNMPAECGTVDEQGKVIMPPLNFLSSERFERHGLFLIEDGHTMFLWVGRDAVPQLVEDVFGLPNYEALRPGKITLPILDNAFSPRVRAIVQNARASRHSSFWPTLYVVKEDGDASLRMWALSMLIQDRADGLPSYHQFLGTLKEKVNGDGY